MARAKTWLMAHLLPWLMIMKDNEEDQSSYQQIVYQYMQCSELWEVNNTAYSVIGICSSNLPHETENRWQVFSSCLPSLRIQRQRKLVSNSPDEWSFLCTKHIIQVSSSFSVNKFQCCWGRIISMLPSVSARIEPCPGSGWESTYSKSFRQIASLSKASTYINKTF